MSTEAGRSSAQSEQAEPSQRLPARQQPVAVVLADLADQVVVQRHPSTLRGLGG